MKATWKATWMFVLFTATTLAIPLAGCGANEAEAVRACYNEYVQAEATRDGSKAVMLVSQSMKDYFTEIRTLVLEAGPEQIKSRQFCDRMFIAMIRHRMDLNYVKQLTGDQLYMVGVRDGWLTAKSPGDAALGSIEVDGNVARAEVIAQGRAMPFKFEFVKENGQWKMDPMPAIREMENMLRRAFEGKDVDLDQLVLIGMERNTGKPVSPTIWDKPKLK